MHNDSSLLYNAATLRCFLCLDVWGLFGQLPGIAFCMDQLNHTERHMSTCLNVYAEKVLQKIAKNVKKNANILTTHITDVFVVSQITMSSCVKLRVSHWPMFDIKSPQEHPSAMPITATSELVQSFLLPNDSEICPTLVFCLKEEPL